MATHPDSALADRLVELLRLAGNETQLTALRRGFRHGIIDRNPVDGYRVPGGSGVRRTYVDPLLHSELATLRGRRM